MEVAFHSEQRKPEADFSQDLSASPRSAQIKKRILNGGQKNIRREGLQKRKNNTITTSAKGELM